MEQANQLYRQYLEDARNLAKVGQDVPTLKKAEVFANIAAAIAATGFVTEEVFNVEPAIRKEAAGKESLERKPEPKKKAAAKNETVAPEPEKTLAVSIWLDSEEFKTLKELEKEPEDRKQDRINYLLEAYGSKQMKDLPPETFNYFHLEMREMDLMKYYLKTWKADPERWRIKAATEISGNRTTNVNELTVEEYLTKLIPAIVHMNYILSFSEDQRPELLQVLEQVSKGTIKKIDDIRFRNVDFIRLSIDSVIDGTFDEIEKVS